MEYDINDPTDLDIMKGKFNAITANEFDEYIALAEEIEIGCKKTNILKSSLRKAGMAKYLSPKLLVWVLRLVNQLDEDVEETK